MNKKLTASARKPTCLECYRLSKQCGSKATCARCIAQGLDKKRSVRKAKS